VPLAADPRDPQLQSQNQEQHTSGLWFQELSFKIAPVVGEIFWEALLGFSNTKIGE
jgi:hypothetical protein